MQNSVKLSIINYGKRISNLEYGELLGHSLYFYSKDVGKPVRYIAPSFAHDVTQKVCLQISWENVVVETPQYGDKEI